MNFGEYFICDYQNYVLLVKLAPSIYFVAQQVLFIYRHRKNFFNDITSVETWRFNHMFISILSLVWLVKISLEFRSFDQCFSKQYTPNLIWDQNCYWGSYNLWYSEWVKTNVEHSNKVLHIMQNYFLQPHFHHKRKVINVNRWTVYLFNTDKLQYWFDEKINISKKWDT